MVLISSERFAPDARCPEGQKVADMHICLPVFSFILSRKVSILTPSYTLKC